MSQVIAQTKSEIPPGWLRVVQKKVESLHFGVVPLVVHDGRVTQIECTEKTRLQEARDSVSE